MKIISKNPWIHPAKSIILSRQCTQIPTTYYIRSIKWRFFFVTWIFILLGSIQNADVLYAQEKSQINQISDTGELSVSDFLPQGYVTDGSISYQVEIQKAIDATHGEYSTLTFPPMVYRVDEAGLKIHFSGIDPWQ